jgi:Mg2+ and Co2+ transporter CorA
MMHFHEDPKEKNDRAFWAIMSLMILLALFCVAEIFVRFYLQVT